VKNLLFPPISKSLVIGASNKSSKSVSLKLESPTPKFHPLNYPFHPE
jgi:hypothetical protein